MGSFSALFKKAPPRSTEQTDHLMLSQLAALYVHRHEKRHREAYLKRLQALRLPPKEAASMFDFDCTVIKAYPKDYLLAPDFTQMWFFGLKQPFFLSYPKMQPEVLEARFLTVSELCKLIDEAEWHFWNSHEKSLSAEVWQEIWQWRRKGRGGDFAISYYEMISRAAHIPMQHLAAISNSQGAHLSQYKWSKRP